MLLDRVHLKRRLDAGGVAQLYGCAQGAVGVIVQLRARCRLDLCQQLGGRGLLGLRP